MLAPRSVNLYARLTGVDAYELRPLEGAVFDIHKIKPVHGWREFFGEVGIIVLGVLIALAFESLAEEYQWHEKVRANIEASTTELAEASGVLRERVAVQPCLNGRLKTLDAVVKQAQATGSLPNIEDIGMPPFRPFPTSAWDDAVSTGLLSHLNYKRRDSLAQVYPILKTYLNGVNEESSLWATLHMLENKPGPASESMLTEASIAIAKLHWGSNLLGLTATQLSAIIAAMGIKPDYRLLSDNDSDPVAGELQLHRACQEVTVGG